MNLWGRIMRLFRPCRVTPSPTINTKRELTHALERAEAVADHVIINADFRKKEHEPLIVTTREAAEQVRRSWG